VKIGKIKVLAHRYLNWDSIPVFKDGKTDKAINRHCRRILDARTFKKKDK
jgi:hypothetical protein